MNAFPRVISYYDMPNAATTYEDLERLRHDDLRAWTPETCTSSVSASNAPSHAPAAGHM